VLAGLTAAGLAGQLPGRKAFAAGRSLPSAARPRELVFAALGPSTDDAVLTPAMTAFSDEAAIKASVKYGGDAEFFQKVVSWYAAGEDMDAVFVRENFRTPFAGDGVITPITKMPGVDSYLNDASPSFVTSMKAGDDVWGLPFYGEIETIWYNEDNFKRAGLSTPPMSWDELLEQAKKAKKAGFNYPMLWAAGQGDHHLPWQWFTQVWSRGDTLFNADGTPRMGPGSVARKTLQWWRDTFQESQVSDPRSAELRYIPAMKAFMNGEHVFLGVMFNTYLRTVNDPAQSPVAGKIKQFMMPGNGKTMGYSRIISMVDSTKSPDWTFELMQYLGGKDSEGVYKTPREWSVKLGYIPSYNSLWDDPALKAEWSKTIDFDMIRRQAEAAAHVSTVIPVVYESWYQEWQSDANVQLQNCILGKSTADEACDAMTAKASELKSKG
jgi:ABC-type glycerol-3-phosphate transport system substrate-binding protein